MPTSVINRHLSLDWDHIKGFISEDIRGIILIYNVCGIQAERAWILLYYIILLDPVTTHNFSHFQLMLPHHTCMCLFFRELSATFQYGETAELEGKELTIITPPHHSQLMKRSW